MPVKMYSDDSVRHMFHRFIVGVENNGKDLRAFCPLCEDPETSKSPSATFTPSNGLFACKSGKCPSNGGERIVKLVQILKEQNGFNVRSERMKGMNAEAGNPSIVGSTPEKYLESGSELTFHNKLIRSKPALEAFMDKRGLTLATIKDWKIGWDGDRYTIPVYDEERRLCNIRKYKLGSNIPSKDKMFNVTGYGAGRLFGVRILQENDEIVLTEGELDCIVLNQFGIPAVTHTSGASTFKAEWAPKFVDKTVYVCYDNDEGGKSGAEKAAGLISSFAKEVFIVIIPIPNKGADITDFLIEEGQTADDFRKLMAKAKPANAYRMQTSAEAPVEGLHVSLLESQSDKLSMDTLDLTVIVSGKADPPYTAPKRFQVNCSQDAGTSKCKLCPVFARDGQMVKEYQPNDPELFKYIDVAEEKVAMAMKRSIGARCNDRTQYTIEEYYNLEELFVSDSIEHRTTDESFRPLTRHVFSVSTHSTEINSTIRLVGRNLSNPKNNKKSFMAWVNDPVKTSLDNFVMTESIYDSLIQFRAEESPLDKCLEIAKEMENTTTKIRGRALLQVAMDLLWHSPLRFSAGSDLVEKGWLDVMVIGDTRTGKSEMAKQLTRAYQAGVMILCEGVSFAGLVGGVTQTSAGSHVVNWGVIPLNDRRLVVLDEVSSVAEKNIIEQMSSIRSTGIAQIMKIANAQTSARTRLLWITNPQDGAMLEDKPDSGIGAMRTVVKNNEDIARFDFVVGVRADDVDGATINNPVEPPGDPLYSAEACASLVLWAWSLQPEQIRFTPGAVQRAKDLAENIHDEYLGTPPLIQSTNFRFKLYRIAAALAARTFSISSAENGKADLLVKQIHIDDAKRFLDMIYSTQAMPYKEISKIQIDNLRIARERASSCMLYLEERKDTVLETLKAVGGTTFRMRDFEEFGAMSRQEAALAVQDLQKMKMIYRKTKGDIAMSPVLVRIMREIG